MVYRARLRSCPGCHSLMAEVPLQLGTRHVEIDACQACGGAFMEFADGTPARLARAIRRTWRLRANAPPLTPGPCASCERPMALHDQLPGVLRCGRCGAVFANCAGLEALSLVYVPSLSCRDPSWLERLVRALLGP